MSSDDSPIAPAAMFSSRCCCVGSASTTRQLDNSTTVVLYGNKSNWWTTYSFSVFRLFDFPNDKFRILDGGRNKWEQEKRSLTTKVPQFAKTSYEAPERNDTHIRAFKEHVLEEISRTTPIVDVRSPGEFSGKVTHMADYPQDGVLRGGHIPRARSVPWGCAANPDGSFKNASDLRAIYETEQELGLLQPGGTIVEPTSGNTGIGLAQIAAVRRYKLILCLPSSMSEERKRTLTAYGAKLALTDPELRMLAAIKEAEKIRDEIGAWMPNQFANPANPRVHCETTGSEL